MYYIYLLQSIENEDKRYIGYTSNLKRRLQEHNSKHKGYTGRDRWRLVYYEAYLKKSDAIRREKRLKDDGRARYHLMKRVEESLKY